MASTPATFEAFSRGSLLNYYVYGVDDKINVDNSLSPVDKSLWYFQAPSQFLGNLGISYGGSFKFTLGSFSGDFSRTNGDAHVVVFECSSCVGPVGPGITLAFPARALQLAAGPFSGAATVFSLPLRENAGWLKDPQNSLVSWRPPTKCDLIQVLSRLSAVRILGDWTPWYESVALDDVQFANTLAQIPVCAMVRPDASICDPATCH